jgi:hypothetical protein
MDKSSAPYQTAQYENWMGKPRAHWPSSCTRNQTKINQSIKQSSSKQAELTNIESNACPKRDRCQWHGLHINKMKNTKKKGASHATGPKAPKR